MAETLVACGYATHAKEIPYGLTKVKTYEVYVNGVAQLVNPHGNQSYSPSQLQALNDYVTIVKSYE